MVLAAVEAPIAMVSTADRTSAKPRETASATAVVSEAVRVPVHALAAVDAPMATASVAVRASARTRAAVEVPIAIVSVAVRTMLKPRLTLSLTVVESDVVRVPVHVRAGLSDVVRLSIAVRAPVHARVARLVPIAIASEAVLTTLKPR